MKRGLNEAIAFYSELIYFETYHPAFVDWWWRVRVGYLRAVRSGRCDDLHLQRERELHHVDVWAGGALYA